MEKITITFHGAAGTVTGSNFLLSDGTTRVLVDCGLTQGKDFCDSCNFDDFEYDPAHIDALIITHAHLDHIGRAPKLLRDGFDAPVYMTPPTKDLTAVMLEDSNDILRREAEKLSRPPMYEKEDIEALLDRVETYEYHKPFSVGAFTCEFFDAGHILGSAMVRITHATGKSVLFTGDLGNVPSPLLPDTEHVEGVEYLVMESVYGDRLHEAREERSTRLRDIIVEAVSRGGTLMIPAFSMERTQILLYELSNMMEAKALPEVPVFLDSPLAIKVTEIYKRWSEYYKKDVAREALREGDIFDFPFLEKTMTKEESQAIGDVSGPKIVIAGAGMSHGGRIQHHQMRYLEDPASTLLIVGYQTAGSLGRLLQDGAKKVRIYDREVRVRATIETLSGFSAHADRDGLMAFVEPMAPSLKTAFLAMGEPGPASFLAQRLHDFLGVKAILPQQGEEYELR